jgi:hypothetical protein
MYRYIEAAERAVAAYKAELVLNPPPLSVREQIFRFETRRMLTEGYEGYGAVTESERSTLFESRFRRVKISAHTVGLGPPDFPSDDGEDKNGGGGGGDNGGDKKGGGSWLERRSLSRAAAATGAEGLGGGWGGGGGERRPPRRSRLSNDSETGGGSADDASLLLGGASADWGATRRAPPVGLYKLNPVDLAIESAWFQPLKLKCNILVSNFAFNLYRYNPELIGTGHDGHSNLDDHGVQILAKLRRVALLSELTRAELRHVVVGGLRFSLLLFLSTPHQIHLIKNVSHQIHL